MPAQNPTKLTKAPPDMKLGLRQLPTYSMKRHASFNSPAEVPLPTPTPSSASPLTPLSDAGPTSSHFPFPNTFQDKTTTSTTANSNFPSPHVGSTGESDSPACRSKSPSFQSRNFMGFETPPLDCPPSSSPTSQRSSSASLPLPSHIPYASLPMRQENDDNLIRRMTTATVLPASAVPPRSLTRSPHSTVTSTRKPPPAAIRSSYPTASTSKLLLSPSCSNFPSSAPHSVTSYPHPAPDPPTIVDVHDNPVAPISSTNSHRCGEGRDDASSSSSSSASAGAPYSTFLSQLPAPKDAYIECETYPHVYVIFVHLPGFQRDAITLATKRKRILHVVADSWGDSLLSVPEGKELNGSGEDERSGRTAGGHFERRIAFGYDADLVQVRAEFDGNVLKIRVPRKQFS